MYWLSPRLGRNLFLKFLLSRGIERRVQTGISLGEGANGESGSGFDILRSSIVAGNRDRIGLLLWLFLTF
jgi:hypothetical protein